MTTRTKLPTRLETVKELSQHHTIPAINKLARLMQKAKSGRVQLDAANAILDEDDPAAVRALARPYGLKAMLRLVELLKSENKQVRQTALATLNAYPALLQQLSDLLKEQA